MFVSKYILEDARKIVETSNIELPAQIPAAPAFYVALSSDDSLQAFGGFVHAGIEYQVGTRKP